MNIDGIVAAVIGTLGFIIVVLVMISTIVSIWKRLF